MTPTQLDKIKGEFFKEFRDFFLIGINNSGEDSVIYKDFTNTINAQLKLIRISKGLEPSWRCGKCEQEEMMAQGIAIPCPIPEHSIRCPLRNKVVS